MAPKFRTWDDYFIPGSSSVLKNKLGETTEAGLKAKEEARSLIRIAELDAKPITGRFDYEHMKAIHRHIFQDTYDWAGEERVGPDDRHFMTKGGPDPANPVGPTIGYQYAARWFIGQHLDDQYGKLKRLNYLRGLEKDEFVEKLADIWGEINFAHAFREGNTRTQIVFFDQLCEQAGYTLNREAFLPGTQTRDEFVNARFRVLRTGRHDTMAEFLDKVVEPIAPQPTTSLTSDISDRKRRYPELFQDGAGDDGPEAGLEI